MNTEYYIISEGERRGPYSAEVIRQLDIKPDTMVWRQGMPDWAPASELAELADIFAAAAAEATADNYSTAYYAMVNGRRIGPLDARGLAAEGIDRDTPVWCQGMADWAPAYTRPELMEAINTRRTTEPPEAPGYNPYARYAAGGNYGAPQYQNGRGYPTPHTNWMPWAVAGTVAAFLFSCIGVVFGIIGIVQANKANDAYAVGNDIVGEQANSTARIMTIISLVFAGVGLIGSVLAFVGGIFSGLF